MATRIEDGGESSNSIETVDQLRRYAEEQDRLAAQDKKGPDKPNEAAASWNVQVPDVQQAERDGTTRHAEAVDKASEQQDRGEDWARKNADFKLDVPVSVNELAKQETQAKEDEKTERERTTVADLQQQLMNQAGQFRFRG